MDKLKVVVLVSTDPSDIYFANQLIKRLNVVGVVVEKQYTKSRISSRLFKALKLLANPLLLYQAIADDLFVKEHFRKTRRVVEEHFGDEGVKLFADSGCKIEYTEGINAINDPIYVNKIKEMKPDVIAVCGASILKKPIISIPPKGILNLHGGLAQKYRGTCTTLWALFNGEPEYIGATVHYVSEGIDDGRIIYQGRPDVSNDDNPETLYAKVVKLGIEMMVRAITDIEDNTVKSVRLNKMGTLYLSRMLTPDVFRKIWENIDTGVINAYLANKHERDKNVHSIMQMSYSHNANRAK